MDSATHPPTVSRLEYKFYGWLGGELLESFPCFIVTEPVALEIIKRKLTGFTLGDVLITKSDAFYEMQPSVVLPNFSWLKVEGDAGLSDFGIASDHRLVVSIEAKKVLGNYDLGDAIFEVYN